jgi:predicted P-loop ATPase
MASTQWGASPDDWDHFDLVLGLGSDLLPVVSNPQAEIDPDSKLKDLGKTPSRFNKARKVVGIAGWTDHQASDQDITRWARDTDLGICLQTRTVRALDIDVPDFDLSKNIRAFILLHLGQALPCRSRENSGKLLLGFTLRGEFAKRKMVVEGGIVEFLANGQQFIAVGTHPSGVRYDWQGGLPSQFPELTEGEFESLWSAMAERFATEEVKAGGAVTVRKRGDTVDMADPVANHLREHAMVLGEDREGALLVRCPWDAEHTTGSAGDGSTVWFPAGTNGYDKGHFKCLHGHCEGRTDGDFFGAIGYVDDASDEFDVLVPEPDQDKPLPAFKRDKNGRIEATVDNVTMALRRADYTGMEIRFDEFRDEIMWAAKPGQWQAFTDPDYVRLRIILEKRGFKPIGRELVRDVVLYVASETKFDSAMLWLDGLSWDGTPRVEQFLYQHFGCEDTPYTRAVSTYLWTALAGRVVTPGVKADMVPILVGAQGAGKSTAVAAIAPAVEFFCEVSFHEKDEDLSRKMRGRLVAEIGELRGLHTKELEGIKAFITRTHENWIPKYREFATQFPRRLVFIGTTNKDEFLADETGNRRWLPVEVQNVDVEGIKAARNQLWAEARQMYDQQGVVYRNAEKLAGAVHEKHTIVDPWVDAVGKWLDEPDSLTLVSPGDSGFVTIQDALRGALKFDDKHVGKREEMRMASVLSAVGYKKSTKWMGGKARKVWQKSETLPPHYHLTEDGGNEIPF